MLDATMNAIFGKNAINTADVNLAIKLVKEELTGPLFDIQIISQVANELNRPNIPYSTYDLAVSVALNLFKCLPDDKRDDIYDFQIQARLKVSQWHQEKRIVPALGLTFENCLYEHYHPSRMRVGTLRDSRDNSLSQDNYVAALKYSELIIKNFPSELASSDWYRKGLCHYSLKQDKEAIECYQQVISSNPQDWSALTNIAISKLRLNEPDEAFSFFREALKINHAIGPAWLQIGCFHLFYSENNKRAFYKAINSLRRAAALMPDIRETEVKLPSDGKIITIGELLRSSKSIKKLDDRSILIQDSVNTLHSKSVELSKRALHLCEQELYNEAIHLFDEALDIEPNNLEALYNKGRALISLSRYPESLDCCQKVAAIDPDYPDVFTMMGNCLNLLSRYGGAIGAYNQAVKRNKADFRAWYNKAHCEEKRELYEEAIKSYKHFISNAPREEYQEQISKARLAVKSMLTKIKK